MTFMYVMWPVLKRFAYCLCVVQLCACQPELPTDKFFRLGTGKEPGLGKNVRLAFQVRQGGQVVLDAAQKGGLWMRLPDSIVERGFFSKLLQVRVGDSLRFWVDPVVLHQELSGFQALNEDVYQVDLTLYEVEQGQERVASGAVQEVLDMTQACKAMGYDPVDYFDKGVFVFRTSPGKGKLRFEEAQEVNFRLRQQTLTGELLDSRALVCSPQESCLPEELCTHLSKSKVGSSTVLLIPSRLSLQLKSFGCYAFNKPQFLQIEVLSMR